MRWWIKEVERWVVVGSGTGMGSGVLRDEVGRWREPIREGTWRREAGVYPKGWVVRVLPGA